MQLEHATHLAQHWELDVVGQGGNEIVNRVLTKALKDGYIQTVRGRDARGHKRRKRIGTRRRRRYLNKAIPLLFNSTAIPATCH